MKPRPVRLCIYPKDIQRITGKGERYSRNLMHLIRQSVQKKPHQAVTVHDLCQYLGLSQEEVQKLLWD